MRPLLLTPQPLCLSLPPTVFSMQSDLCVSPACSLSFTPGSRHLGTITPKHCQRRPRNESSFSLHFSETSVAPLTVITLRKKCRKTTERTKKYLFSFYIYAMLQRLLSCVCKLMYRTLRRLEHLPSNKDVRTHMHPQSEQV